VGLGGILGYLDDRLQLRARWQFIGQFVLAAIAVALGIGIEKFPNPFGGAPYQVAGSVIVDIAGYGFDVAVAAITTIWIVGMLNSVNFVDGLDGLLGGIALIAVTTLGIVSLTGDSVQPAVAVMCGLMAGALLGFLRYNFHPARVFIGTSGVFAVGYALAVLSVLGTAKLAVALLVLGVPIIDTFWIIIRRTLSGRSPFSADRGHFHHRLLDLGLSHRQAVLLIYAICIFLAALSLILPGGSQITAFVVIVLGGGIVLYLLTRRAREALDRSSYTEGEE
jgi:UDP-GlcNAc:undecaprenyl-phosphate GlcNAc-1-phosphate transferase